MEPVRGASGGKEAHTSLWRRTMFGSQVTKTSIEPSTVSLTSSKGGPATSYDSGILLAPSTLVSPARPSRVNSALRVNDTWDPPCLRRPPRNAPIPTCRGTREDGIRQLSTVVTAAEASRMRSDARTEGTDNRLVSGGNLRTVTDRLKQDSLISPCVWFASPSLLRATSS